jgi:hypothetical protein
VALGQPVLEVFLAVPLLVVRAITVALEARVSLPVVAVVPVLLGLLHLEQLLEMVALVLRQR